MPKKPNRVVEAWWFILPDERQLPASEQSRFRFAPITQGERMRLWDERERIRMVGADVRSDSRAWQQARELVLEYLVATENVPSDAPEAWPGREASDAEKSAWLERNLDDITIFVLGTEIWTKSALGPSEKN